MSISRQQQVKDWFADNGLLTVLMTALTIAIGFASSEVQNKIGWGHLLIGIGIVWLLYCSSMWLVRRPIAAVLLELKEEMQHQSRSSKFDWLIDTHELVSYERNIETNEIWLITADLLDDAQGGPFLEVVRENLRRKILHTYFYPATVENRARVETIKAAHNNSGYLRFVSLPDNFFLLVPKLDICIYNPRGSNHFDRTAFLGIPVRGEEKHYHASVSTDLIDKLVGTLLDAYHQHLLRI